MNEWSLAATVKVPNVADVLGLLGGSIATAMMMIIPALIMEKCLSHTPGTRAKQILLLVFAPALSGKQN